MAANLRLESVRESTGPSLDIARPPAQPSNLTLWYSRATTRWDDALPVGTGRLGVMICGDVARERLQVNDDTLWSGRAGAMGCTGRTRGRSVRKRRRCMT